MKKLILFAAIISAAILTTLAQNNFYGSSYSSKSYGYTSGNYYSTPVHVKSYVRSNGTYVNSHYRTSPDYSKSNNWSSYPNVNPYTGKIGTIRQW